MRRLIAIGLMGIVECHGSQQSDRQGGAAPPPESEAPVALNPDVPIAYPPALFEHKVEGDVTLRLYVESTGKLGPGSTRGAEARGYTALGWAARACGVTRRLQPAKRHGGPV